MNRNKGFTLIELIIVIVILSVLTATALPRFVNLEEKATDAILNSALTSLESAARIGNVYARTETADAQGDVSIDINGTPIEVNMVRNYPIARPAGNLTTFLGIETLMDIDDEIDIVYDADGSGTTTSNNRADAIDDYIILTSAGRCVSYRPPQGTSTEPEFSDGVQDYDEVNQTCP